MRLEHRFSIPAPVNQAWAALMDVKRVGECLPGATITSVDGDEFSGSLALKVGPVNANYQGSGHFETKDPETRVVSIVAGGTERRGSGSANATITAHLTADGDGTQVEVSTDLTVTGRLAQIGRGPMNQISAKIMAQFAERLKQEMSANPEVPETAAGSGSAPVPETSLCAAESPDRARASDLPPLNLVELALDGRQRAAVIGVVGLLVAMIVWCRSRGAGS